MNWPFSKKLFSFLFIMIFCHYNKLEAQYFEGETHFHVRYNNLSPTLVLEKFKNVSNEYNYKFTAAIESEIPGTGQKIVGTVMIGLFNNENRKTKITESYFDILTGADSSCEVVITKQVHIGEQYWGWGLHNPFGLFDFPTYWEIEPKNSPFTNDQLKEIDKILNKIGKFEKLQKQ